MKRAFLFLAAAGMMFIISSDAQALPEHEVLPSGFRAYEADALVTGFEENEFAMKKTLGDKPVCVGGKIESVSSETYFADPKDIMSGKGEFPTIQIGGFGGFGGFKGFLFNDPVDPASLPVGNAVVLICQKFAKDMTAGVQAECQVVTAGTVSATGAAQSRYINDKLSTMVFPPNQAVEQSTAKTSELAVPAKRAPAPQALSPSPAPMSVQPALTAPAEAAPPATITVDKMPAVEPAPATAPPAPPAGPVQKTAPEKAAQPSPYPPLTANADGKPKVAAHRVRLENGTVELALQILAPGKTIEAVRIDNLGGISSLWRSDGKDKAAPLSVSIGGKHLSSGAQTMNFAVGDAEVLLALSLQDNGAFAGKTAEFRVTVFFVGGERALCALGTTQ